MMKYAFRPHPRNQLYRALAGALSIVILQIAFSAVVFAQTPGDGGTGGTGGEEDTGTIDALFKFLIATTCYFAPYLMVGTILSWAGKVPRALGNILGQRGRGVAGNVRNWAQGRRSTTAPALSHQFRNQARREERTSEALNRRYGANAPGTFSGWLSRRGGRLGNLGTRMGRTEARAAAIGRGHMGDDEGKQLGNFNAQHMQALAMAGGDAAQAVAIMQRGGIDTSTADNNQAAVQNTANALQQQGVNLNNPSTMRTIGDQGAKLGMSVDGYDDHFRQNYGGGNNAAGQANNPAMAAQAGGITANWNVQRKQNGQFSQAMGQIPSLASPSNSDLPVVMNNLSQQARASATPTTTGGNRINFGNNDVLNQAVSHFANARVGIQLGDAAYTARKTGIIQQGENNFLAGIEAAHGQATRRVAEQHIADLAAQRLNVTTRNAA